MHDILPGTAIPKAYEYAWNDEFIAMNGFSEVLKNSVRSVSHGLNTQVEGRAVVVYNPVAIEREDIVTAELTYPKLPVNIKVIDKNGATLLSQIISTKGNTLTVIFLAKLPSAGFSVFDIRETTDKPDISTLSVTNQTLENKFFKVKIDANGDIASIYDKQAAREVLSKPSTLDFQFEFPTIYPAWNMEWKDRKNPPIDFLNKDVNVKIIEQGPVRVALEVTKKGRNSELTQIISLATGEAGKKIEVRNKLDWQSKEVSLKAAFPTTVANEFATYSLNTAAVQRTTNNEIKFEVPGRQWIDLTDRSNNFGVSILEDCKYGSDKPDNSTLRLTLMYTPKASSSVYQGTQDWGIHDFIYAIYPHVGDWVYSKTPWQGNFINNPPIAFETSKHNGNLGKEVSLLKMSTHQVDIMAFKKAEESGYYIVRVNELYGKDAKAVSLSLPAKIEDAYEVNGQERKIGPADFRDGTLHFDMTKFLIRSFAVKLENPSQPFDKPTQVTVELPYDLDGISFDKNRKDGNLAGGLTLPGEMLPAEIVSEDIRFKVGNTADGQKNVVGAKGQKINLPAGDFNKLYILAASTEDTQGSFKIGNQTVNLGIQDWTGFVGQHYSRVLYFNNQKVSSILPAFTKRDNIAWFASHRHTPEANDAYQYSYLYKYEINLPKGTRSFTLPDNDKIKVFAITVANNPNENVEPLQPLYDDFRNNKAIQLRIKEIITPDLQPMKYSTQALFDANIDQSTMTNTRTIAYLKSLGMDTVIVKTPSSTSDYADVKSGNNVSVTYYATGKSTKGKEYRNTKLDISCILNSGSGKLADTVLFDNGEGRIVIDLQKSIPIDKINFYIDQFRNRGSQIFSIWASATNSDITGDPKTKGWQYVGIYGAGSARVGGGGGGGGRGGGGAGITPSGISLRFNNNLNCRYLMIVTDGNWHGTEYFKQLDIFEKK
jgi:alpha-mannosidase